MKLIRVRHYHGEFNLEELVRIWAYTQRGLGSKALPRLVRRPLCKTSLHRAWLQEWIGSFLLPALERCQ